MLLTKLFGEENPNLDNRLEIAKIIDEAVVGVWDEFSNKSLPFEEFRQKKGLQYERSSNYPYSGFYVQLDKNKRIRNLRTFKDGYLEGPSISWRENGLKFFQGNFLKGKKDGVASYWSKTNIKVSEQNYKDGKLDGLTIKWYQNGQKSSEQIFHNGKIVSAYGWRPDGERCPSTRVVDGVGILLLYDDFGEERAREKYSYEKSKRVVEKYENGKIREEGYSKNGKKEGIWIYYRLNGTEHFRITYRNGEEVKTEFSSPLM